MKPCERCQEACAVDGERYCKRCRGRVLADARLAHPIMEDVRHRPGFKSTLAAKGHQASCRWYEHEMKKYEDD